MNDWWVLLRLIAASDLTKELNLNPDPSVMTLTKPDCVSHGPVNPAFLKIIVDFF